MFNLIRGWLGEKKTRLNLWVSLNSQIYRKFHDLYIPTFSGTAQIDHLIISQYGLFIVETKNIKGWIFGDESAHQWTQLIYGNKYRFQNPLRQTYRQKKALAAYLNIDDNLIQPIVYFAGDCQFKTYMPTNVINGRLRHSIKSYRKAILSEQEVSYLISKVENHQINSKTTNREHVKGLRERYKSTTICPKCGSPLVKRVARTGVNAGSYFWGCDSFPKCRYIKNK
ncbi:nuclease-related domain-containing protein [Shewanella aestuarii]|uniref:NERD domain-containing protein n=1 Tax=Shewanella aestuarii TaxID=1028752 RepID=A0A6G9QQJ1_9GAMM|nr:NERD domain-containing protein [Shewanella aestuarii]QIR16081.1 NERD domain-containing protein [Shewanella aestuarii]